MKVSVIVAIAENNVIGKDNALIWRLPADLQFFKNKTTGHHIIMGRKTFESIGGGKPLPNRTSIVITRQTDYNADGCIVVHSIEDALAKAMNDSEVFIIGGSEIYKQAIDFADTLYITRVHESFQGDTFFPDVNYDQWDLISKQVFEKDEKNLYAYSFLEYRRGER